MAIRWELELHLRALGRLGVGIAQQVEQLVSLGEVVEAQRRAHRVIGEVVRGDERRAAPVAAVREDASLAGHAGGAAPADLRALARRRMSRSIQFSSESWSRRW